MRRERTILVDYGMEQGGNVYENAELPIPFSDVDYIFITQPTSITQACFH